jgi:hypothetical protein
MKPKQPTYKERLQKAFDLMDKGMKPEKAAHENSLNYIDVLQRYEERRRKCTG